MREHVAAVVHALVLTADTEWPARWPTRYEADRPRVLLEVVFAHVALHDFAAVEVRQTRGLVAPDRVTSVLVPFGDRFMFKPGVCGGDSQPARSGEEFN